MPTIAGLAFTLVLAGIVANATVLQKGHHPAPLFSMPTRAAPAPTESRAAASAPAARPVVSEAVPPRAAETAAHPAERPAPSRREDAGGPVKAAAKPAAKPAASPSTASKTGTPVQAVARSSDRNQAGEPSAKTPKPAPTAVAVQPASVVVTAQRALAKLGYDVKPDGHMGAATRQALDKFARGRGLAADGLSPRLVRELAAAAGRSAG